MKPAVHPYYRTVVFHDTSVDHSFNTGSINKTDQTLEIDGETFPYVALDISSASHPNFTGKQKEHSREGVRPDSTSAMAAFSVKAVRGFCATIKLAAFR